MATAATGIYPLSLHDALPICLRRRGRARGGAGTGFGGHSRTLARAARAAPARPASNARPRRPITGGNPCHPGDPLANEHRRLGELLLESKRLTPEPLDRAIAEHCPTRP